MIHICDIPGPWSLWKLLILNTKGITSNYPGSFQSSTFKAPWYGNRPGYVNPTNIPHLWEDWEDWEDYLDYDLEGNPLGYLIEDDEILV